MQKPKTIVAAVRDFEAASPGFAGVEKKEKLSIYSGAAGVNDRAARLTGRIPVGEACGRTGLRHWQSRAALPSQSLAPGPRFVSSCSQPPPKERCKALPWLLLMRPAPGDSTLKFHWVNS